MEEPAFTMSPTRSSKPFLLSIVMNRSETRGRRFISVSRRLLPRAALSIPLIQYERPTRCTNAMTRPKREGHTATDPNRRGSPLIWVLPFRVHPVDSQTLCDLLLVQFLQVRHQEVLVQRPVLVSRRQIPRLRAQNSLDDSRVHLAFPALHRTGQSTRYTRLRGDSHDGFGIAVHGEQDGSGPRHPSERLPLLSDVDLGGVRDAFRQDKLLGEAVPVGSLGRLVVDILWAIGRRRPGELVLALVDGESVVCDQCPSLVGGGALALAKTYCCASLESRGGVSGGTSSLGGRASLGLRISKAGVKETID